MADEIKVYTVEFADRACFQMQYRDLLTRKLRTRSTGIRRNGTRKVRTEAERVAAKWEAELREGRYQNSSKVLWDHFRDRYEKEVLASLAEATDAKVAGVFNSVEEILSPYRLRDLTADRLSHFQSKLRENGLAESTIAGMLAHLRAAFNWAVKIGMLPSAPKMERPRRAKGNKMMKGRPITLEEFERMLDVVPAVVLAEKRKKDCPDNVARDAEIVRSWQHYLRGLWLSGLRLGESLDLHWDRQDKLRVEMDGGRPMIRIPAGLEKGNADRLLPMSPEFAEFLSTVPVELRYGPVFKPLTRRGERPSEWWASRVICAIGEKAGVKVDQRTKADKVAIKYASAHDLRRSFGARWATRVMPQVLMELMRHESIETTLKYYVGRNAETTADVLWAAHNLALANTSSNSQSKQAKSVSGEQPVKRYADLPSQMDRGGIEPPTHGFSVRCSTN